MYPDFRYLIHGLFGIHPPEWVGIFKTFGLLVAISFLCATWVMVREMTRKEEDGLLKPEIDKKTQRKVYPHERISEIVMIAAIGGLVGAKLFNAFETWNDFIQDPIGNLFSRSGLTFYGGFITATAIFYYYARKHKIRFAYLCDAAAPAIMLAYGVGRLGCQSAGDGDWGIYNSAYVTGVDDQLKAATMADYKTALQLNANHFIREHGSLADVPQAYVPGPSWMPRFFMAMNYPSNVNNNGVQMHSCIDLGKPQYCSVLPVGVFPTPLYECIVCVSFFFLMWAVRRRIRTPFHMFGLYLILAGIERFFVEKIRVNYKYDWGFIHPTQAEIISVALIIIGTCIMLFYRDKQLAAGHVITAETNP